MNIADEHAGMTQDVLLHQKDGIVNLSGSASDADERFVLVLVSQQKDRGSAHVAGRYETNGEEKKRVSEARDKVQCIANCAEISKRCSQE